MTKAIKKEIKKPMNRTEQWERAIVFFFTIEGWKLEWVGDKNLPYDAIGTSDKGNKVCIEMKFRNRYYKSKILEKNKYDKLMALDDDIHKLYFVNDPKANYLFYLNEIKMPEITELNLPDTTRWAKKRMDKDVYLLEESDAIIMNLNNN